jgi:SAM-dependent methyltransferase
MSIEFYNEVYISGHPSGYDGGANGMPDRVKNLWSKTNTWLIASGLNVNTQAKICEVGSGMCYLSKIHKGWHGAEYSKSAVQRVKERDGEDTQIFEEDAQYLSFQSNYFDGIFTWATLEHVPNPDKAFREIHRVLKRARSALIAPAWNCRSWTVKKIEQQPLNELSIKEKIELFSIPIREHIVYRALFALPKRCWDELHLFFNKGEVSLRYKSLQPNYELIEKYGHVSDDDALADIDIHSAILFFKSRGYIIKSHPSFFSRLFSRHEPLIVQKP